MHQDAIDLFSALADRSPSEREEYYAKHQVTAAVRDEVESLLRFDTTSAQTIRRYVASAANEMLAESGAGENSLRFGPFRPIRLLGRGGMGQVFLATQETEEFQRQVALKLIDRPILGEQDVRRFRDEVRILASLEHPGIARFLDAGRAPDGTWFLALEYVDGEDLFEHVRRVDSPIEERIHLFLSILEAVAYAHAHLVVHRDLKPSNIMVGPDGRPRLLDFGIAKLLDPESGESTTLTRTELRVFTPAYASPEQFRGEKETAATDVHALGVLLYELLAGVHPFGAPSRSRTALESSVLTEDPAPPSAARRDAESQRAESGGEPERRLPLGSGCIDSDLDAICLKALRKDPRARYPDAAAFAEDLRRFLNGLPVDARQGGRRYRLSRFLHRNRGKLATASAVGVALAAVVFALLVHWRVVQIEGPLDPPPTVTSLAAPPNVSIEELERRFVEAPHDPDAGAELAWALLRVSRPQEARVVVGRMRQLPGASTDPVVDLIEATAATALDEPQRALALSKQALAHAQAAGRDDLLPRIRGAHARHLSDLGQRDEARAEFERARRDAERAGDKATLVPILNDLAVEELQRGHVAEGERRLEEALVAARAVKDTLRQGSILHNLAGVAKMRSRPDLAEPRLREAVEIFRTEESPRRLAMSLGDLSLALQDLGRPAEVDAIRDEAIAVLREVGDDTSVAHVLAYRGGFAIERARLDNTEATAREIEEAAQASGHKTNLGLAELLRGRAAAARGDAGSARRHLGDAHRLFDDSGEGDLAAEARLELASTERQADRHIEASRLAEQAAAPFRDDTENGFVFRAEVLLARIDVEQGRFADAERRLVQLGRGAETRPTVAERIAFLAARAELARARGRFDEARADLETAIAVAREAWRKLDELHLRLDLAETNLARGDRDRALAAARQVAEEASASGLGGLAARARRLTDG
jgi:serine/threonine-protein kinase